MRVTFYRSDKVRERILSEALALGVRVHGDDYEIRHTGDYGEERRWEGPSDDTDVALCCGVKGQSKAILTDHVDLGKHCIFIDKGYTRMKGEEGIDHFHRFSVDAFQPLHYLMQRKRKMERWRKLGIRTSPRRFGSAHSPVIFAGSSLKFHTWHKIGDPTEYAKTVVQRINKNCKRPTIYRPKPSWKDAVPIPGATFSDAQQKLSDLLTYAHCLVTYGSNAGFDAICHGVPVITLGDGISAPVSKHDIESIDDLFFPTDDEREQWLGGLAWSQFALEELRSGEAWADLRDIVLTVKRPT